MCFAWLIHILWHFFMIYVLLHVNVGLLFWGTRRDFYVFFVVGIFFRSLMRIFWLAKGHMRVCWFEFEVIRNLRTDFILWVGVTVETWKSTFWRDSYACTCCLYTKLPSSFHSALNFTCCLNLTHTHMYILIHAISKKS